MEEFVNNIVFLGEPGIGAKTSLIERLIDNKFDESKPSTCGCNYSSIIIQINLGLIQLALWDTVGQELFRPFCKHFIKVSHCIILGFDITNKHSFNEIKKFHYNNYKEYDSLIYLVANKIDLIEDIEVSEKEAIDYAKEKGIKFFRISCKTGEGINELFEDIINLLVIKFKKIIDNNDKNLIREITKNEQKFKRLNINNKKEI